MDKFLLWLRQLQWDTVWQTGLVVLASLLCITFHETCHGLAAYALGDDTARRQGRLSLNPLKHVDLMGLVVMALCHFGWAKPVPVNMRRFKNPKAGMALTALAGPLSNLLLAYLAVLLYAVCWFFFVRSRREALVYLLIFLYDVEIISAGLAVFNIFPIPPLDGSKVLFALLPDRWYDKLMRYERYGMLLLAVLLLTNVLDSPLLFLRGSILQGLETAGQWPLTLLSKLYH